MTGTDGPAIGARVLVIEDDRDTSTLLCSLLRIAGFEPLAVSRRSEAMEALLGYEIAAVVVSLSRSGIDAVTSLVVEIRKRPEPRVGGAALIALVDEEFDLFFGLGDDADASLVRPFPAEQLIDAVTEVAASGTRTRASRVPVGRYSPE